MDKAPGVLFANQRVQRSGPVPRLRLLTELEPGHRVFFRNLADLLLSRRVPQIPITSRPVPFWDDVFVPSGAPWSSFLESMLCHSLLIILFVWGQSRVWVPLKRLPQRDAFHRSITYYPLTRSFPAVGGRAPSVRARSRVKQTSANRPAHQPAMSVTPEQKPSLVTPPDIKQATARLPNFLRSHAVTPVVPFPATADPRRNTLAGPSEVVAPPPQVDQATAPRLAPPQASSVAPAPELGGPFTGRAMKPPNTGGLRVVPPPPSVQGAGNSARAGRLSSLSGAGPSVVPPPPSAQGAGNAARLGSMAGAGSQVVPPPPSVQGAGNSARAGRRLSSLSGAGPSVVPPPPSVQGAGNAARLGSMTGADSQVVPPPPSVQGAGNSAGAGRLSSLSGAGPSVVLPPPSVQGAGNAARLASMAGAGSQVVPPPPSVQGAGNSAGTARIFDDRMSPTGLQVVPPPPSVQGSGGPSPGTRLGSLSGAGSEVVPPSPSAEGAGHSAAGARLGSLSGDGAPIISPPSPVSSASKLLEPMDPLAIDASSPPPAVNTENRPTVEELPLGLLGVVFAAPGSSFFSNFEVFVAKRRVGKGQLRLIKLVYEFLPYQQRLSEYDLNNQPQRVIKLRVTPDPSCDESLGQIMQVHTDPTLPTTEYPKLPAALRFSDPDAVLPCYRTTAGDFQRAMSRAH